MMICPLSMISGKQMVCDSDCAAFYNDNRCGLMTAVFDMVQVLKYGLGGDRTPGIGEALTMIERAIRERPIPTGGGDE